MVLYLHRSYYADGTNGVLTVNTDPVPLCFTIELPWRNNRKNISCIPAGTYVLKLRYSLKFKWHLHVQKVPGRTLILFHPANHAILELQGCIAPVSTLTGPGRGEQSREAFRQLMRCVTAALGRKETLCLTILPGYTGQDTKPMYEEDHPTGGGSYAPLFQEAA